MIADELNNKNTILIVVGLFLVEVLLTFLFGVEDYKLLVTTALIVAGGIVIIEPFYGLLLVLIVSFFVEGNALYEFVLFRAFGFNWYVMEFVFLFLYLGFLVRVLSGAYTLGFNSVVLSVSVFLLFSLWGVVWGIMNGNQFQSVFYDFRGFFYYLTFFPAALLLDDKKKLRTLFYFLLILGTIKSAVDCYRSLFVLERMFDPEIQQYVPFSRLIGINEVVYPLTFLGSFTYFILEKNIRLRLFLLPSILLSASALYLSYTRGSWLAVFVCMAVTVFLFLRTKRYRLNMTLISAAALMGGIILGVMVTFDLVNVQVFLNRITSLGLKKIDISNLGRMVEYATALEAFFDNPVFGKGLGFMFTYFAPGIGEKSTEYCHNSYLYVLAKMGLFGLIPFIIMVFSSVRTCFLVIKANSGNSQEFNIAYSLLLMLLFLAVKALTTWHLNTVTFSMFVGILFGISTLYLNKLKKVNE